MNKIEKVYNFIDYYTSKVLKSPQIDHILNDNIYLKFKEFDVNDRVLINNILNRSGNARLKMRWNLEMPFNVIREDLVGGSIGISSMKNSEDLIKAKEYTYNKSVDFIPWILKFDSEGKYIDIFHPYDFCKRNDLSIIYENLNLDKDQKEFIECYELQEDLSSKLIIYVLDTFFELSLRLTDLSKKIYLHKNRVPLYKRDKKIRTIIDEETNPQFMDI